MEDQTILNCPICNAEMEPDRDVLSVGGAFVTRCLNCCYRGPYSDSWDAAVDSWNATRGTRLVERDQMRCCKGAVGGT